MSTSFYMKAPLTTLDCDHLGFDDGHMGTFIVYLDDDFLISNVFAFDSNGSEAETRDVYFDDALVTLESMSVQDMTRLALIKSSKINNDAMNALVASSLRVSRPQLRLVE